jgi:pimeloyl-ACP methyl ester carboxylesterase
MTTNNWIFLRGLTRGNAHWSQFPEIFLNQNPGCEIELLEIPGNGTVSEVPTSTDPLKVIEFIRNKSQFCQQKKNFNLCGISLGGMIALKWAELYPSEVQSLSLINSSLRETSPFYQRLRPQCYLQILKAALSRSTTEQESLILQITSNNFESTKENIPSFAEFAEKHPVTIKNLINQLILANKITIQKNPALPMKVIWSERDRLVNNLCSQKIALKLNAKTYIHPTAGHDLPLDAPDWLSNILSYKQE